MSTTHYGMEKTREQYVSLALTKIAPPLREQEATLRTTRWFDYRGMTPAQATYLFAALYREHYRSTHSRIRDIESAATVRPFSPEDIFACKELTGMWQARQCADSIGCKYGFFLNFIFRRNADRGWRFMPRPNQMVAEELVLDIADAWQVECAASLQLATDPMFLSGNYTGSPEQVAYYDYLERQVKSRQHAHMALARIVFTEQIMPHAEAERRFGTALLERSRRFYAE